MGYMYECIPEKKSVTKGHVKQYRQSLYRNIVFHSIMHGDYVLSRQELI